MPEMLCVGTQTDWLGPQTSNPQPSHAQSEDKSSSDLSWIPDEERSSESSDQENPEEPKQESLNDPK